MSREEREAAIAYIKSYRKLDEDLHNTAPKDSISYYATDKCLKYWDMAIQALEQMPEVTSTMYVPIRETKDISCTECKHFKITQEPLRGMGGLIDLGQARCEKHDLIKDFAHHGQFKYLKPCEYYEDFKEGDKE